MPSAIHPRESAGSTGGTARMQLVYRAWEREVRRSAEICSATRWIVAMEWHATRWCAEPPGKLPLGANRWWSGTEG